MKFYFFWLFFETELSHSQLLTGFSGTGYSSGQQAYSFFGDSYGAMASTDRSTFEGPESEYGMGSSAYVPGHGTGYGGYGTDYPNPEFASTVTEFSEVSKITAIPYQFITAENNNSDYGFTVYPTDFNYTYFTSPYDDFGYPGGLGNYSGGTGMCQNNGNALYPGNKKENSIDLYACENKTVTLKSNWSLPTGSYKRNQSCLYKIKIPADNYAIAEVQFENFDLGSWFKLDNTLGYSFVKMAGSFSLPPPDFQFYLHIFEQATVFRNNTITKFNVTRKKFNLKNISTINLEEKGFLLSRFSDFFKMDKPIRLEAEGQIQIVSICNRDYDLPSADYEVLNGLTYFGSIAQNIFILRQNGTDVVFLDTLHSNYFNTQKFPSPVLLYPGALPDFMPCMFFAFPLSRKDDFQQMKVALAGRGSIEHESYQGFHRPIKEFTLNATEKQSCLVLVSREKDMKENGTTFVGVWLLPVVLPNGGTLRIYSDFSSKTDNSSRLLHEFRNSISSPIFLSGFARTLVLDCCIVTLEITEFLNASEMGRFALSFINQMNSNKQLVAFSGLTYFTLTVTHSNNDTSSPDGKLSVPSIGWSDDDIDLFQSAGTISMNKTDPRILLYPGTGIELVVNSREQLTGIFAMHRSSLYQFFVINQFCSKIFEYVCFVCCNGFLALVVLAHGTIFIYSGIPDNPTISTATTNTAVLNTFLNNLRPGDEFIFPARTFYLEGGVIVKNITNVILRFEGTLIFTNNTLTWPKAPDGRVFECFYFENIDTVTFTSSSVGLIDGQGEAWWGLLGYAEYLENRPRILTIANSRNLLVENMFFKNSPYWTVWIHEVDGLEIRNSEISARKNDFDGHDDYNLVAFNTDGFDVTGKNVYIHDCKIWNQDDCIAVKDGSENMLFERINASGLGLVIGSIGGSTVRNVTFRDSYLHKTFKGIYTKFRGPGLIQDILYENIEMFEPEQWPIWIGPAQQADSVDICKPSPCSLCWPEDPKAECNMPPDAQYINITLRNITIINPVAGRAGVIIGPEAHPIQNVVFDNVVVQGAKDNYFVCTNVVNGTAIGGTSPVPSCFTAK